MRATWTTWINSMAFMKRMSRDVRSDSIYRAIKKILRLLYGCLHCIHRVCRGAGADGGFPCGARLSVFVRDDFSICGDRLHVEDGRGFGILCRRPAGSGLVQWHGDRRRLDVGGVFHRSGRHFIRDRLRWPGLHHGLDRRLLPGGAVACAVFAQVRSVYDPRFSRRPLWRQYSATDRSAGRSHLFVYLCHCPDLRGRSDR